MVDQILSQTLYVLGSFIFALSACRYTVIAIRSSRRQLAQRNKQQAAVYAAAAILLIAFTWVALPLFIYSRSQVGGFIFIASLLFFFSRAHRDGHLKP